MRPTHRMMHLLLAVTTLVAFVPRQVFADAPAKHDIVPVRAQHGMVVSQTRQASEVGKAILEKGGNAVDAAVATALALAVTWPEAGNIGGGGFMMIAPPDNDVVCIDYRETAPLASTEDMYAQGASRHDYKAVGVPGTVAGLYLAHQTHGRLPWRDLVMPSVELARDGFVLDIRQADSFNHGLLKLNSIFDRKLTENMRQAYGKPDGVHWKPGDRIVLPDLVRTLELIANGGADAFYKGPIATQIEKDMKQHGGLITREDLAKYKAVIRQPIHGTFQGYDIFGPPPPSSGGITLILELNILEALGLDRQAHYSAANTHKIIEAMRRAYRDRAAYLGDPDFVTIPDHLTTKPYAAKLAADIDLNKATPSEDLLGDMPFTRIGDDTTHFSVVDDKGMAVSNTYTLEQAWGSCMVITGLGFVLNNEMGDFNWAPDSTNNQGRIGTPANLIRPGKRMLSSQCPVILKKNGKVVLITGSPGGRTIINTVLEVTLNVTLFGMLPTEAVNAPRFHHQWFPDQVRYEPRDSIIDPTVWQDLAEMGHQVVKANGAQGSAHSIAVTDDEPRYFGVADNRRGGSAKGY